MMLVHASGAERLERRFVNVELKLSWPVSSSFCKLNTDHDLGGLTSCSASRKSRQILYQNRSLLNLCQVVLALFDEVANLPILPEA